MAAKKRKQSVARSIEELTSEYQRLNERRIQTQTQLEEATKQLDALQKEAEEEFGTSDVAELRTKLAQMEAENEKRRSEYQTLLEGIATELEQVEQETTSDSGGKQTDDE